MNTSRAEQMAKDVQASLDAHTQSKKIKGHTFSVLQWHAEPCDEFWWEILGKLGPHSNFWLHMRNSMAAGVRFSVLDDRFGLAINDLAQALGSKGFIEFAKRFLEQTRVDGKLLKDDGVFESVFWGNPALLYSIVMFVAEVNFSSFFDPESFLGTIADNLRINLIESLQTTSTPVSQEAGTSGD
jgi:hypothetical protein